MKLDEAIEKRRSIRSFTSKSVKWDHLLEAIDAALQAPLAGNISNVEFIIVEDQKRKNKLHEASQQNQVSEAPFVIVVISNNKNLENLYYERAEKYATQQVGAAIENLLLKLTDMGISSCWVGAFTDNKIKTALQIPKNYNIEALIPVGYTREKPKKPKKASLDKSIHWEEYGMRRKPTSKEVKQNKLWK